MRVNILDRTTGNQRTEEVQSLEEFHRLEIHKKNRISFGKDQPRRKRSEWTDAELEMTFAASGSLGETARRPGAPGGSSGMTVAPGGEPSQTSGRRGSDGAAADASGGSPPGIEAPARPLVPVAAPPTLPAFGHLEARLDELSRIASSAPSPEQVAALVHQELERNSEEAKEVLARRVSSAVDELRSSVETFVRQAKTDLDGERKNVAKVVEALAEEGDAVRISTEERVRFVKKYQPGTVAELEQRNDRLRAECERLEGERRDLRSRLEAAEVENRRLQAQSGLLTREELDRKMAEIHAREANVQGYEKLKVQYDACRARLDDLEGLRQAYERGRETRRADDQLRRERDTLRAEAETIARDRDDAKAQLERARDANQRLLAERARAAETERRQTERIEQLAAERDDKARELEQTLKTVDAKRQEWERRRDELESTRKKLVLRERAIDEREHAEYEKLEKRRSELQESLDQRERLLDDRARALEPTLRDRIAAELGERLRRLEAESMGAKEKEAQWESARSAWSRERSLLTSELEEARAAAVEYARARAEREAALSVLNAQISEGERRRNAAVQQVEELAALLRAHREECDGLEARAAELKAQNSVLAQAFETTRSREEAELRELRERKRKIEEQTVDRDKRLAPIVEPWDSAVASALEMKTTDEAEWLADIHRNIEAAGFSFPLRLVEAFHTSLKIAPWAPLTALAGVSGTGKSELPRLYAYFGGLRFLSVPVQPNWDSPQDLFGFFNYMDGRFRATDLIRALYQGNRPRAEGGLADAVLLVLLDEMNRARFELYFSELLSRLESRRGAATHHERCIQVDLGAGVEKLEVELTENVLYVGTMNEDESTHSLADMVLDRGNVISFPRPRKLKQRDHLSALVRQGEVLPAATWHRWRKEPAELKNEVREEIGAALGEVNQALAEVNRAIGHRVLQAVESYVVNHPRTGTSEDGWKHAFADQLAQKIMPKLRGIEVSSKAGGACLGCIHEVLVGHAPTLRRDFERARDSGDGSFLWANASYLEDDT